MAIQKPSIPKGTRDFTPVEAARRNYIFSTIRGVFKQFGYLPIETPAMENLSTLLGKYGEEGDKLLFKVLNSGDAFSGITSADYTNLSPNALSLKVCEKGLRYDLTVPFARFVVQHQNEITFPFKRYQLQPVWRADRPQKGRYREFYQCDADVIGSKSQLNELELVQMVEQVFSTFGINVLLKINNRKVLSGLAEVMGCPDKLIDMTICIDKLDKIELDKVKEEMLERGIPQNAIDVLQPVLEFNGGATDKIALLRKIFSGNGQSILSATGLAGVEELEELFSLIEAAEVKLPIELDLSLARGLNYYTGAIFEVKALDFAIGSICGGGRYDNLTGIFGLEGMSGVGISFGADRIYDVLLGLDKFPANVLESPTVIFFNLGEKERLFAVKCMSLFKKAGIKCEIYPDTTKMKKQFEYATKRNIPYAAIIGEDEIANNAITLKNLADASQERYSIEDAIEKVSK